MEKTKKDQGKAAAIREAIAALLEEMTVEQLEKVYTVAKYLPQAK